MSLEGKYENGSKKKNVKKEEERRSKGKLKENIANKCKRAKNKSKMVQEW